MTTTPKSRDDNDLLAAEYVLGLLPAEDRAKFAARLASSRTLQASVRKWEEHFKDFADEVQPVAPPADVARKLDARLFPIAAQTQSTGFWSSLYFWRGLAMTSLAGLIALSSFNLRDPVVTPEAGTELVAQVTGETNSVTLAAYYDEAAGELRLNRIAGNPAANRSFELWLIAGQDAPVSLGVVPSANPARISVPENLRAKFKDGVLAVSDEPQGGSPTGAPTGAVLATGKLTVI
jgi:anti-sigma-K factor RskA